MATVGYTIEQPSAGVTIVTWTPLTETNADGLPFVAPYHTEKTFQVEGTFGAAGACDLEGTLFTDQTNFRVLSDPQGTDISIATADKHIETRLENVHAYRPKISAGTGVSLTAKLLCVAKKT